MYNNYTYYGGKKKNKNIVIRIIHNCIVCGIKLTLVCTTNELLSTCFRETVCCGKRVHVRIMFHRTCSIFFHIHVRRLLTEIYKIFLIEKKKKIAVNQATILSVVRGAVFYCAYNNNCTVVNIIVGIKNKKKMMKSSYFGFPY